MFKHEHGRGAWTTLEVDGNGIHTIAVFEANLDLNTKSPNHNPGALKSLLEAAQAYVEQYIPHAERMRIVPSSRLEQAQPRRGLFRG